MTGGSPLGAFALAALGGAPLRLRARPRLASPRRVVLVSHGENPSADYYLRPRLDGAVAAIDHVVAPLRADPAVFLDRDPEGTFVLFCRYMSARWMAALDKAGDRIAGVGLFLDDDIEAVVRDSSAPLTYRLRLIPLALRQRARLSPHLDRLWAATPALARRLGAGQVLPPLPGRADAFRPHAPGPVPRIAFHATGVHAAEHAWLAPIVARLLAVRPSVEIEVIASGAAARAWRRIPGVRVLAPMAWPDYRAYTANRGFDIMLAPLLDSPVNRMRSCTKRIDAARAGAALIANAPAIYAPNAEEIALGMNAPEGADAYLAAIVALVDDTERRARLAALNAAHVSALAAAARPLFPDG